MLGEEIGICDQQLFIYDHTHCLWHERCRTGHRHHETCSQLSYCLLEATSTIKVLAEAYEKQVSGYMGGTEAHCYCGLG